MPNLKRLLLTDFIYCLSLAAAGFSELAADSSFLSPRGGSEEDAFNSLSPSDISCVEPSEGVGEVEEEEAMQMFSPLVVLKH